MSITLKLDDLNMNIAHVQSQMASRASSTLLQRLQLLTAEDNPIVLKYLIQSLAGARTTALLRLGIYIGLTSTLTNCYFH